MPSWERKVFKLDSYLTYLQQWVWIAACTNVDEQMFVILKVNKYIFVIIYQILGQIRIKNKLFHNLLIWRIIKLHTVTESLNKGNA